MKNLFYAVTASACLLAASSALAGDRDHFKEGMHQGKKGEHFLQQKLDLSDAQLEEIRAIREAHDVGKGTHKRSPHPGVMSLDPSASDYSQQVEQLAQRRSEEVKQAVIERGTVHAQIYAVLTPEQKEKMKVLQEKRLERQAKRFQQEEDSTL